MKKATIDLTDCKYLMDLHERIRVGLDFPKGYGRNWSAFWDMLNRDCQYNFVTIKGSKTVAKELHSSVEKMKVVLERNKQSWAHIKNLFDYEFID